jgi:adenosylmethionine-8-amino-7-oxononanoate aminotransferase
VATGMGRTGRFLASEALDLRPDLVCLGKGLSNGYLPLAATLATERIFEGFRGAHGRTFFHGHTFTGNPLACAAGIACLELYEREQTLTHVARLVDQLEALLQELDHHPRVRSIRQTGLMVGLDLQRPDGGDLDRAHRTGNRVCQAARDFGVLLRPLGDTLVLMPPLCMSSAELQATLEGLRRALDASTT